MATTHTGATRLPTVPFTLRQLECFIAVADAGTITAAASILHASDSAVSDAVTAMERAIGTSLIHRKRSRGANLTSDGLAVLPIARRMLTDAEELLAAVGSPSESIAGPVRLGALDTLAPVIVPRLITAAASRLPFVRLECTTGEQTDLIAALDAAQLDLVLTFDIGVPPEHNRRILASTRAGIVVAAGHPLSSRPSVKLDEVADEPMILLDIEASRIHTLELMSSRSITPRIVRRTSDYELCRAMVGRGLGYTLLMRRDIDARTWDGGRVVYVDIEPPPREVDVQLVWKHGKPPARVAAVVDVAAELEVGFAPVSSGIRSER